MRILAPIVTIGIVLAAAMAGFFFGGFYSVAGTAPDLGIVHWALIQVRTASIDRHAADQPQVAAFLQASSLVGGDQITYLQADICRAPLLVEIEASLFGVKA